MTHEEALASHARFEKACRSKDADAVWAALAPGGQADVVDRAKRFYEGADAAERKRVSGLDGEPDDFTPQDYLESQLGKSGSTCPAGEWRLSHHQSYSQLYLMVRHVGGACEGLWFARTPEGVGVFPAGWYSPCPDDPAARVIADVGKRGKELRQEQANSEQPSSELVTPAQVKAAYAKYTKACKAKDVDAMWELVSDDGRRRLTASAAEYHSEKGRELLRQDGWTDDIENYDARAHFERKLDAVRFCPVGGSPEVLAMSESPSSTGWVAVKTSERGKSRCDVLDVSRDGESLKIYGRRRWFSKCPPEQSLSELLDSPTLDR